MAGPKNTANPEKYTKKMKCLFHPYFFCIDCRNRCIWRYEISLSPKLAIYSGAIHRFIPILRPYNGPHCVCQVLTPGSWHLLRRDISALIHEFLVHLFAKSQKILTFSMRNWCMSIRYWMRKIDPNAPAYLFVQFPTSSNLSRGWFPPPRTWVFGHHLGGSCGFMSRFFAIDHRRISHHSALHLWAPSPLSKDFWQDKKIELI